jgi:hypothetical protein
MEYWNIRKIRLKFIAKQAVGTDFVKASVEEENFGWR